MEEDVTTSSRLSVPLASSTPQPNLQESEPNLEKSEPKLLDDPLNPAQSDNEKEILSRELDKYRLGKSDPQNTEFVYYSATLREIAPGITNEVDRHLIIPWIRKLFRPEYHSIRFRDKRNKYLLHLVLLLMNDEAWGIFRYPPPEGALKDPEEVAETEIPWIAEWEKDDMWQEIISALPPELNRMSCSIHASSEDCQEDKEHGKQLDEEFRYLLYLTRPFCVLLRSSNERTRAAAWLQMLCTIRPNACDAMKRVRNEYCTAMLGYVHELRLVGPFSGPPFDPLPPLADLVRMLANGHPVIDPCGYEADVFLASQPIPDEGAFCYLAITGELLDSTMHELD